MKSSLPIRPLCSPTNRRYYHSHTSGRYMLLVLHQEEPVKFVYTQALKQNSLEHLVMQCDTYRAILNITSYTFVFASSCALSSVKSPPRSRRSTTTRSIILRTLPKTNFSRIVISDSDKSIPCETSVPSLFIR